MERPALEKEPRALDQVLNQAKYAIDLTSRIHEQLCQFTNSRMGDRAPTTGRDGPQTPSPINPVGGVVGDIITALDQVHNLLSLTQTEMRRLQRL